MEGYKSEPMDIIESMSVDRFTPAIFAYLTLDSSIDSNLLLKAVELVSTTIPQIYCYYDYSNNCYFGNVKNIDQIITYEILLPEKIDFSVTTQLKIFINDSKLTFLASHMLTDGQGFKELILILLNFYNDLSKGRGIDIKTNNVRNLDEVIRLMPKVKSVRNLTKVKYPISIQKIEGTKQFLHLEKCFDLSMIRELANKDGLIHTTVNDVIMAAYLRSIAKYLIVSKISVEYPRDMRRYISKKVTPHYVGNFVGDCVCNVEIYKDEPFMSTLQKVTNANIIQKNENNNSINDLRLLRLMNTILPKSVLKWGINVSRNTPSLSMTNFGVFEKDDFNIEEFEIQSLYMTGSYRPLSELQLSISSFENNITVSWNVFGSQKEISSIKEIFSGIVVELVGK